MLKSYYDVIVVGSGPNGLAAAIKLQSSGINVLLIEAKGTIGGGMRTNDLTLSGFKHDVCSAIHPLAVSSPFFRTLPLENFGLEWLHPKIEAAHTFDSGEAVGLYRCINRTADQLGKDGLSYLNLISPIVKKWDKLLPDILSPLSIPRQPFSFASFGLKGSMPATVLASLYFKEERTKGFWAGMAAHSIQPLTNFASSAIGLVLLAAGHTRGWPIAKGGSQTLANSLAQHFCSIGGEIETEWFVKDLAELPSSKAVVFDTSVPQLLKIVKNNFTSSYQKKLKKFRYGMGIFKVDWALDEQIPFQSSVAKEAGTVHLGSYLGEVAYSEFAASKGIHSEKPYVILAQQSIIDKTRSPDGKHTAWAYCHVPSGSTVDMTEAIENQIERYAPGFKDTILAKHKYNSSQLEEYNANYVGGDINGGALDIKQLFMRPVVQPIPYRTSAKNIYLCSSSTPPGGGVHGMCGYHAANRVISDLFK